MKTGIMTHRELCEDLAHARSSIFVEVPLGSPYLSYYTRQARHRDMPDPPRADVVDIRPSYTRFCLSIFECKVSRADFLSDIRRGKWKSYLPECHRLYFALLSGVGGAHEIPAECGLYIRGQEGWRCVVAAPVRDVRVSDLALMSLLFYRQKNDVNLRRREHIASAFRGGWVRSELRRLGKRIARGLHLVDLEVAGDEH